MRRSVARLTVTVAAGCLALKLKGSTIFETRQDATDGAAAHRTDWNLQQHRCDNPKISLINQSIPLYRLKVLPSCFGCGAS